MGRTSGRRETPGTRRRREREADERRARRIAYAVAVVLGIAAVLIGGGLYITQYQPPRSHVATIDGVRYDARTVGTRGAYFALFEGGLQQDATTIPDATLDRLAREAALHAIAVDAVGEVTEPQIQTELRNRFGFIEGEDEAEFAEALQQVLRDTGMSRDAFFVLVAAQILAQRLGEGFLAELGHSAPQVNLTRVRLTSAELAEEFRDRWQAGEALEQLAAELAADTGGPVVFGWTPRSLLSDEVREAVAGLQRGDLAEPVVAGSFFDLYAVIGHDNDREFTQAHLDALSARGLGEWFDANLSAVAVTLDLSDSERDWIINDVIGRVNTARGG